MSDTPRIDALMSNYRPGPDAASGMQVLVVADLARQLERECFALAANQCHGGYGDERGHHRCKYQDERDAAIAQDHEAIVADRIIERALGRTEALDGLIAWLDANGAANTVCRLGDSPRTTIRRLIESFRDGFLGR